MTNPKCGSRKYVLTEDPKSLFVNDDEFWTAVIEIFAEEDAYELTEWASCGYDGLCGTLDESEDWTDFWGMDGYGFVEA
jgi:hypothetical protein